MAAPLCPKATHRVRFLFPPRVGVFFTQGGCGNFASALAERLGGQVVALASTQWESVAVPGRKGVYYHNPIHYLALVGDQYVDVTGVYFSKASLVAFWRHFLQAQAPGVDFDMTLTRDDAPLMCQMSAVTEQLPRIIKPSDLQADDFRRVRFLVFEKMDPLAFLVALRGKVGGELVGAEAQNPSSREMSAPFAYFLKLTDRTYVDLEGVFEGPAALLDFARSVAARDGIPGHVILKVVGRDFDNPFYDLTPADLEAGARVAARVVGEIRCGVWF